MQATLALAPSPIPTLTPIKTLTSSVKSFPSIQTFRSPVIKVTASATANANDPSTVDYNSVTSVFPAEACETVGGDACDAEMYPEVKLKPEAKSNVAKPASETVDRDYLEYNSSKTVFPGEACDDLGGEFCEPEYQSGVY